MTIVPVCWKEETKSNKDTLLSKIIDNKVDVLLLKMNPKRSQLRYILDAVFAR